MRAKRYAVRKMVVSAAVACAMAAGTVPCAADEVQAAEVSGMDEIAAQVGSDDDSFAAEEGHRLKTRSARPSYYDLRDVGGKSYVTEVKVQNPFGSCWGFGAICAAETSIIGSGMADAETLDLSEKQVAWFIADAIHDKKNPQYGEGMIFEDSLSNEDRYDAGGVTAFATNLFASGVGPTKESTVTDDGLIYRYSGRAGLVNHERVFWYDDSGNEVYGYKPISYSEDDDWSMPEKYRFYQDYSLRESIVFPSPGEMENGSEKENVLDAIKDQLLSKRAVAFNFHPTVFRPGQTDDFSDYMGENWAQYDYNETASTHVVTIVGYDDHFPKSEFLRTPPGDGAFLAKNSWGSDLNSFPNNGYRHFGILEGKDGIPFDANARAKSNNHTGYFWISYYDTTIRDPEAYIFEPAVRDQIINQHDLMPVSEYEEYSTEAENCMANVFTADGTQKLTDISIFTTTPGTSAAYKVYLLEDDAKNPTDGVIAAESSEELHFPYGGFHKVALPADKPVYLAKGQKFSVIVSERTPSGKYSISFAESEGDMLARGGRWFESVINKGESYLYIDGMWRDLSDSSLRSLLKDEAFGKSIDNFSIKAYSVPAETGGAYLDVKNRSGRTVRSVTLAQSESTELTASIRGGTGELPSQPVINWEISDPEIIQLDVTEGAAKAALKPKKAGTCRLSVDAGIYGKKIIEITVSRLRLSGASLPETAQKAVYTGAPYEPLPDSVSAETADGGSTEDLKAGKDYTVTYENNVKCGRGQVIVTGIGQFEGEVRTNFFYDLSFLIIPAKARILTAVVEKGTLKVTFESQKDSGVSGYILTYKEEGTDKIQTKKIGPDASSAVVEGVVPGKTYEVSLHAYLTDVEKDVWNEEIGEYEDISTDHPGEESEVVKTSAGSGSASPSDGDAADPSSVAGTERAVTAIPRDGDLAGSTFGLLRLRAPKVTKNTIKLMWKGLSDADGYIVYGNRCGTKYKFKKLAEVAKGKTTWTQKKLKKGTYYKYMLVAYKIDSNARKVIASSKTVHAATSGGKAGNHKAVKLKKTKVTLKAGKTAKITATLVPASSLRKVKKHREAGYESTNKKVASVSRKGKITARKKGTCKIYVYAQNGVFKTVKVTVK